MAETILPFQLHSIRPYEAFSEAHTPPFRAKDKGNNNQSHFRTKSETTAAATQKQPTKLPSNQTHVLRIIVTHKEALQDTTTQDNTR